MRSFLAVLGLSLLCASPALAVVAPDHLGKESEWVIDGQAQVRTAASLTLQEVPLVARRAWRQFEAKYGPGWSALWDTSTGLPARLMGPGVPMPKSTTSATLAAAYSRAFLAENLALFAPGASIDDFVLVSNDLDGEMRTVGFAQHHRGLRVLGGQLSVRIKRDRLFVVAAEAYPNLNVSPPKRYAGTDTVSAAAIAWIRAAHGGTPTAGPIGEPLVFPLITGPGRVQARVAVRVDVSLAAPRGKWAVYLDAATAEPLARRQLLHFAVATLGFDVPARHPGAERGIRLAPFATASVNGLSTNGSATGEFTWSGDSPAAFVARAVGTLVRVRNDSGPAAEFMTSAIPGALIVWSQPSADAIDAQLATFIHSNIAKTYARTFAPTLGYLNMQLEANVNIDDECNAYSDGETINFFKKSDFCQNTGTLADVIYHEFGHSIHIQSIIDGVGNFDSAFSEGVSDYFAATITNDSGMGRGFFFDDEPLRELDPPDDEARWPSDIGEVHKTGIIIGATFWDLRKAMQAKYGTDPGVKITNDLFYAALRRSSNIPTSFVEVLADDDDDGDLSNGTPNECEILSAFNAHGLGPIRIDIASAGVYPANEPTPITVTVSGESPRCPQTTAIGGTVRWASTEQSAQANANLSIVGASVFAAEIAPYPAGSVIRYQVTIRFADGASQTFPTNPTDDHYQIYVGDVVPLYCTDFETDPFTEGWTSGLMAESSQELGANDWQWGTPVGIGSSGDPATAHSGLSILGNDLGLDGGDGYYEAEVANYIESPPIEVGAYSDVRLQFWRWLNVEDGYFDQARVVANGTVAWENADSDMGDRSSIHHLDSEWRFQDIPVSQYISQGTLTTRFEIWSDQGLEIGGWNLDDFCVVAAAGSICGDGILTGSEQCDDGALNSDTDPDACRTTCRFPMCGDGIIDSGEMCDDGNTNNTDECTATCVTPAGADESGGCGCSGGRGTNGVPATVALLGLAFAFGRRRRSRWSR